MCSSKPGRIDSRSYNPSPVTSNVIPAAAYAWEIVVPIRTASGARGEMVSTGSLCRPSPGVLVDVAVRPAHRSASVLR
jgi:hypothetical protein